MAHHSAHMPGISGKCLGNPEFFGVTWEVYQAKKMFGIDRDHHFTAIQAEKISLDGSDTKRTVKI